MHLLVINIVERQCNQYVEITFKYIFKPIIPLDTVRASKTRKWTQLLVNESSFTRLLYYILTKDSMCLVWYVLILDSYAIFLLFS